MCKIYFNKRCLEICSCDNSVTSNPNAIIYYAGESDSYENIPALFESCVNILHLIIAAEPGKTEEIYEKVCTQFTQINAGGGIVANGNGDYLFIYRNGVWDLPKGKQEEGENITDTALREVKEECGIENIELKDLICITHHCYRLDNKFMLKHTYWYSMYDLTPEQPVPQKEENISKAQWIKETDIAPILRESYPSIREVFTKKGIYLP